MAVNILIVDDSALIRRSIRSCLEQKTDWTVSGEAENGKVAVEMVRRMKPDLVILDLTMPIMNGLDAARAIAAIAPDIPVILFTLHNCASLLEAAQRVGIKHVFSKTNGFGDHVVAAMRAMLPA